MSHTGRALLAALCLALGGCAVVAPIAADVAARAALCAAGEAWAC